MSIRPPAGLVTQDLLENRELDIVRLYQGLYRPSATQATSDLPANRLPGRTQTAEGEPVRRLTSDKGGEDTLHRKDFERL